MSLPPGVSTQSFPICIYFTNLPSTPETKDIKVEVGFAAAKPHTEV